MTLLGIPFIVATVLCIVLVKRSWVPWLLSAAVPFATTPIISAGDNGVQAFYVVAFAAFLFGLFDFITRRGEGRPHLLTYVTVMVAVICAGAILMPTIFRGIAVLVPRNGIDGQVNDPGQLAFNVSNIAQMGYLILGASVVVYFANNRPKNLHFLNLGFIIGTLLNVWALAAKLTGLFFPHLLFDTADRTYFSDSRLRGIFSEPSYLATFTIGAFFFSVFLAFKVTGRKRVFTVLMAAANLAILYYATSGTAIAAFIITSALVVCVYGWRFITGRLKIAPTFAALICFAAAGVVLVVPQIIQVFTDVISGKVGSVSFVNRDASNAFSWDLLIRTWGFGAGLGSNRPSSFFFYLVSNVGLLGTILIVALVIIVIRRAKTTGVHSPEIWALVAVLVAKVAAEPNMSQPMLWLGLAACSTAFTMTPLGNTEKAPARLPVKVNERGHWLSDQKSHGG